MKHDYPDIRAQIPSDPLWYDSNGTPRYAEPCYSLCPNIYASEVCIFYVRCQCCEKMFVVEANWSRYDLHKMPTLTERIADKELVLQRSASARLFWRFIVKYYNQHA